jgi:hypothetical protein
VRKFLAPLQLFTPECTFDLKQSLLPTHFFYTNHTMAPRTPQRKRRDYCKTSEIELLPPSSSPSAPQTVKDTPHRAKLLELNRTLGGKVKKTDIFKAAGIKSKRTGYRILAEGTARRSQRLHNRGRKRILSDHVLDAIEKVEDSSFA